jgi:hypothetical protein
VSEWGVEIEYKDTDLDKLDFRGLVDNEYKEIVKVELLKEGLHLDYITTNKVIPNTENLKRATDEEIINIKRKIILGEIFNDNQ